MTTTTLSQNTGNGLSGYAVPWTLLALCVLAMIQNAAYYRYLPDRTATHFNLQGDPDGWMSKGQATAFMISIQVGLPIFLMGIAYMTRFMPTSLINIPNREYWLHADRRDSSLRDVMRMIGWISIAASIFMLVINHLVFRANMTDGNLSGYAFASCLGVYLLCVLAMVIKLWRRFRLPAAA